MWVMVMYDLPSTSKGARRRYQIFRKNLLKLGFEMKQKSIYLRWEETVAASESTCKKVMNFAPADGHVTVLPITPKGMAKLHDQIDCEERAPPQVPDEFMIC